eukprot:7378453-Prymnesium_polylepis.1
MRFTTSGTGFYHVPLPRGAPPLYAAACVGSFRCAALLLEAGANVNVRTADKITPMLIGCLKDHLDVVMLLSSYGAERDGCPWTLTPPNKSLAEQTATLHEQHEVLCWLKESAGYSPLQHVNVLTVKRATALLRSGMYSPTEEPVCCVINSASAPTAALPTAAQLAREHPDSPAAQVILKAAAPWSPFTHELWGQPHRERAAQLCKIGHQLAYSPSINSSSFAHVWMWHVMPQAMSWQLSRHVAQTPLKSGSQGSPPHAPCATEAAGSHESVRRNGA